MKLMQKTVWAITPEMLSTMISIAHQTNKSPEAIAKEMGRDMKNTYAVSTRGGVAVIPVTGPLFRHANLLTAVCGATSYELLAQDFNKALNDPNISAILFDVDSPGGEVNGCSELADTRSRTDSFTICNTCKRKEFFAAQTTYFSQNISRIMVLL